jgi:hypothetical protein
MIKLEEEGERLALLEGNDGKESIASESQIESGVASSVPMAGFEEFFQTVSACSAGYNAAPAARCFGRVHLFIKLPHPEQGRAV